MQRRSGACWHCQLIVTVPPGLASGDYDVSVIMDGNVKGNIVRMPVRVVCEAGIFVRGGYRPKPCRAGSTTGSVR